MSSAKRKMKKISLCLHIRNFIPVLFHRANARELVKPAVLPAPLRSYNTMLITYVYWVQKGNYIDEISRESTEVLQQGDR